MKNILSFLIIANFFTISVFAMDKLNLNFNGLEVSSRSLDLKSEIQKSYPNLNLQNKVLYSVKLLAKGWSGTSQAILKIDNYEVDKIEVEGDPQDFYKNSYLTYTNHALENYESSNEGGWELFFIGPVKLWSVEVSYEDTNILHYPLTVDLNSPHRPPGPPHYPPQLYYYDVGNERTQKFVETTATFRPQHFDDRIVRVRIIGTVEKVKINKAIVVYYDGSEYELPELHQKFSKGQEIGAFLNGYPIREVRISAVSGNLSGSRGEYSVSFGVYR